MCKIKKYHTISRNIENVGNMYHSISPSMFDGRDFVFHFEDNSDYLVSYMNLCMIMDKYKAFCIRKKIYNHSTYNTYSTYFLIPDEYILMFGVLIEK